MPVQRQRAAVEERTLRAILAFGVLYLVLFLVGAFVLMIDAAVTDTGLRPIDAIGAAATTLGNVGPSFGFAGPMGSFDAVQPVREVGHDPAHVGRAAGDHPRSGAADPKVLACIGSSSFRHPAQLVSLAFALAILVGTGLLMLPVATAGAGRRVVLTAAFTSTSSICVTG